MENLVPFILIILTAAVVWLSWLVLQSRKDTEGAGKIEGEQNARAMQLLQSQLAELRNSLDSRLERSSDRMNASVEKQFSESQRLIQDINKQVGEQLMSVVKGVTSVSESSKQVFAVADQLKELQNILKNPKQRGVLGEYYLETVLQNVLPTGSYQMQYAFDNGEIVDAVVFVKDKIIPVDSKFSLENYNRMAESQDGEEKMRLGKLFLNDLKERIKETAKYIRPSDRTTDFAFMFIPHEGIYYDLLANPAAFGSEENLIQRAAGTYKVIIVSPTSFLAYLQTVLQGLKAMEIEDKAKDIIKNVERLGTHLSKYQDYYQKIGNTLATTVNHYNAGYKELGKIDKDILRITEESAGIEVIQIDKPHTEDEE